MRLQKLLLFLVLGILVITGSFFAGNFQENVRLMTSAVVRTGLASRTNTCMIVQGSCPNHPEAIGTFEDTCGEANLGASKNADLCMKRATDFYNWCGLQSNSGYTTTAKFYTGGVLIKK